MKFIAVNSRALLVPCCWVVGLTVATKYFVLDSLHRGGQ